jgi:Co/Zn/Cd efflux system component
MMVDVVTYLFNYVAERLKRGNKDMSPRDLRLRRLYMELVPPSISVVTLVAVTVAALREAFATLVGKNPGTDDPDLGLMLLFSGLNFVLDVLNVGCFARVDEAIGLPGQQTKQPHERHHHSYSEREKKEAAPGEEASPRATEATPLVRQESYSTASTDESRDASGVLNLNMCSAWTHICADTLRSIAVLAAAGFAYLFPHLMTPAQADSEATVVVSVIILISLLPLIQGLYLTAVKIVDIWRGRDSFVHHHNYYDPHGHPRTSVAFEDPTGSITLDV